MINNKLFIRPFIYVALIAVALSTYDSGSRLGIKGVQATSSQRLALGLEQTLNLYFADSEDSVMRFNQPDTLFSDYTGTGDVVAAMTRNEARGLSLASGDFDEDGTPDLLCGYDLEGRGVLSLHRGNPDAIYPYSSEAQKRRLTGKFVEAPFLPSPATFEITEPADFMFAGDFNDDRHQDVVVARRGGSVLRVLLGDGRGGFSQPEQRNVAGKITTMAVGDIGWADGLEDIVVGLAGPDSQVLILAGRKGALNAEDRSVALPAEPNALAIGQLDSDYRYEIGVACGGDVVVLDEDSDGWRSTHTLQLSSSKIVDISIGDFAADHTRKLAVLTENGRVHVAKDSDDDGRMTPDAALEIGKSPIGNRPLRLVRARISSGTSENLVVVDGRRLEVIGGARRDGAYELAATAIDLIAEPIAVLPMRLNRDAINDLVVLTSIQSAPVVMPSAAMTFTVTNTNDSGVGSLRQAILNANANPGADTISFNIPGSSPFSIAPVSAFPGITDPVSIDGTTQPGFAGSPIIEINGSALPVGAPGLLITGGNSVVRGLVINRVKGDGIRISLGDGNSIEANFIGTNVSGTTALGNEDGIKIDDSDGNRIAIENLISGNRNSGVFISRGGENTIRGNFIGPDPTGSVSLSPTQLGVALDGDRLTLIEENLISGNGNIGVLAGFGSNTGTSATRIQDNSIGTDESGVNRVANNFGIWAYGTNIIVERNIVAFNNFSGVDVLSNAGALIRRNSIFANTAGFANRGLGIDLGGNGVTANDPCDTDTGPNNLQNAPVLTSATAAAGGQVVIRGTLESNSSTTFTLEFYANSACDPSGSGEGEIFLGDTTVSTAASCSTSFQVPLSVTLSPGQFITATATDPAGKTSEFSNCIQEACTLTCPGDIEVDATGGQCSAVVNYPPPTTPGPCGEATCSPASGSSFPIGITAVSCSNGVTTCSFNVTVYDPIPPAATCRPNITVNPPTPTSSCAVVTWDPGDNSGTPHCQGGSVTVYCEPPSGACFPIGSTTVECAASDQFGNTAYCTFTVTVAPLFDYTIQDEINRSVLQFNSVTGAYRFFECDKPLSISGVGVVKQSFCKVSLTDSRKGSDRNISALANPCTKVGSATVRILSSGLTYNLRDNNITNNSGSCP